MEEPKILYHYTTVESLALILKNKTIRFMPLDTMDDLQEKECGDLKKAGQFCYISSWTDDARESIPMWKMYGNPKAGVRIGMKVNPFLDRRREKRDMYALPMWDFMDFLESISAFVPASEMFEMNVMSLFGHPSHILNKVIYTDEKDKLYPQLVEHDGDRPIPQLNRLGVYKNTSWSFQNEWRYRIFMVPFTLKDEDNHPDDLGENIAEIIRRISEDKISFWVRHYDMLLDDAAFAHMEITLSPNISAGNRVIVEQLAAAFNPGARIVDSKLNGLI